ncbi:MAG: hypothetical protein JXA42_25850 [Anaerolineales bacterium]|nr:hypothetical protein [Anaerolineales bacterium]
MDNSKRVFCLVVFIFLLLFVSTRTYAEPNDTMDEFVYLPIISNIEPAPELVNGNFENGETGWLQYSTHGWQIILSSGSLPVEPHGGSWAAWLGGDYDDISFISQEITIPADKKYLHYWYFIGSEDACGYDIGGVAVIDSNDDVTVVDAFWLCYDDNTYGWVERSVDLSAFKNETVDLIFQVETDGSLNSNWFIDDVSFKNSGRSGINELSSPPANGQKPDGDRETLPEELAKNVFGLVRDSE